MYRCRTHSGFRTRKSVFSRAHSDLQHLWATSQGGWLADRFSPRKLICIALLIIAAGSFVFSTIPSFEVCVLIYGIWGLAIALVFWSAMIKAIRNWGGKVEQGRAYGILEGGRSITDGASATLLLEFLRPTGIALVMRFEPIIELSRRDFR